MPFGQRPGYVCAGFPQPRTAYARPSSPALSVTAAEPVVPDHDAIRCDACPGLCYIKPGRTGACDRYGNQGGQLVRLDAHVVLDRAVSRRDSLVRFLDRNREWDGNFVRGPRTFVTALCAASSIPSY